MECGIIKSVRMPRSDLMDSILIEKTTREERLRSVTDALAMASLDCPPPCDEDVAEMYRYVNGEVEIADLISVAIQKYSAVGA
jgi:hypothetical protein